MKQLPKAAALAFLGFIILAGPAVAAPPEEPVAVIVADGVSPDVARAIKRRAAQGKASLIKYLERGRFVYEVRVAKAK